MVARADRSKLKCFQRKREIVKETKNNREETH